MEEKKPSYYQFRKHLDYQIFLRFEDTALESDFVSVLGPLGFEKIENTELSSLSFKKGETNVLKITRATGRAAQSIKDSQSLINNFELESLSRINGNDVYRFKNIGMLVKNDNAPMWELGVVKTDDALALRCILTRYLSFAFKISKIDIVGFWGVKVEQGLVIMSGKKSNYEAVFYDQDKRILLSYGAETIVEGKLEILRLDELMRTDKRLMSTESLIGFLSVSTCHLSYSGIDLETQKTLFRIAKNSTGYIYPATSFSPRSNVEEAV